MPVLLDPPLAVTATQFTFPLGVDRGVQRALRSYLRRTRTAPEAVCLPSRRAVVAALQTAMSDHVLVAFDGARAIRIAHDGSGLLDQEFCGADGDLLLRQFRRPRHAGLWLHVGTLTAHATATDDYFVTWDGSVREPTLDDLLAMQVSADDLLTAVLDAGFSRLLLPDSFASLAEFGSLEAEAQRSARAAERFALVPVKSLSVLESPDANQTITFDVLGDREAQLALSTFLYASGLHLVVPGEPAWISRLRTTLDTYLRDWVLVVSDGEAMAYVTHQGGPTLDAVARHDIVEGGLLFDIPTPEPGLWVLDGKGTFAPYHVEGDLGVSYEFEFPHEVRRATCEDLILLGIGRADWEAAADDAGVDRARIDTVLSSDC
jgi:hypothetical protein